VLSVAVLHVVLDNNPGAWDFGWNSLVAIGTLSLAAFTVWLAWSTRRLAIETADEIAADFRPVLIDAAGESITVDYPQRATGPGGVELAVRNVGPGPAMNATVQFVIRSGKNDWTSPAFDVGTIAPDERAPHLLAGVPIVHGDVMVNAELVWRYEDLAQKKLRTEFSYELDTRSEGASVFPHLVLPLVKTRITVRATNDARPRYARTLL
jgi:hypothetical protein